MPRPIKRAPQFRRSTDKVQRQAVRSGVVPIEEHWTRNGIATKYPSMDRKFVQAIAKITNSKHLNQYERYFAIHNIYWKAFPTLSKTDQQAIMASIPRRIEGLGLAPKHIRRKRP